MSANNSQEPLHHAAAGDVTPRQYPAGGGKLVYAQGGFVEALPEKFYYSNRTKYLPARFACLLVGLAFGAFVLANMSSSRPRTNAEGFYGAIGLIGIGGVLTAQSLLRYSRLRLSRDKIEVIAFPKNNSRAGKLWNRSAYIDEDCGLALLLRKPALALMKQQRRRANSW